MWDELREAILRHFYDDFLGMLVTPRLHSADYKTRASASFYLSLLASALESSKLATTLVYYLLGKDKLGQRNRYSLLSPRRAQIRKGFVDIDGPLNFVDVSRNWKILIENLESRNEALSCATLKLFNALI